MNVFPAPCELSSLTTGLPHKGNDFASGSHIWKQQHEIRLNNGVIRQTALSIKLFGKEDRDLQNAFFGLWGGGGSDPFLKASLSNFDPVFSLCGSMIDICDVVANP